MRVMEIPTQLNPFPRQFVPAIDLGPHKDVILGFYYFFHVTGGCVGLPLTIATMVFTKAVNRRHPTLTNFLLMWAMYGLASSIL